MFSIPIQIRFGDIDSFGHVNNAVYLSYLEMARVALSHEMYGVESSTDFPFIIGKIEVNYRRPLLLTDLAECRISVGNMSNSSWEYLYQIVGKDGTLFTEAKSIQVYYDYGTGKSAKIPDEFRNTLKKYQKTS